MKKFIIIVFVFVLGSCSVQKSISNGAFSDISINVDSEKCEFNRLNEIEADGWAFWGIPEKPVKKSGFVFRFNGMQLNSEDSRFLGVYKSQFVPIFSLIANTVGIGLAIDYALPESVPLPTSFLIAIPFAGTINNMIFYKSAHNLAIRKMNAKLIEENPEIDVFLNPKYNIDFKNKIWTQEATIKANVMGAKFIIEK